MSKITIVSRDDQALLVDVSGCSTFKEAIEQLSSTFLSANQFWQEEAMDLNLGSLLLNKPQIAQIIALANGVGAKANRLFSKNPETIAALEDLQVKIDKEQPAEISTVTFSPNDSLATESPNLEAGQAQESGDSQQLEEQPKPLNKENSQINTEIEQVLLFDTSSNIKKESQPEVSLLPEAPAVDANSKELETRQENIFSANKNKSTANSKKKSTLYLKQTLRAGQAVSHKGDLIIIGDVNAGAEVLAEGDITIWGSLRGIAHAGIDGNTKAEIRALRLQPIQIRIASYIARSPDSPGAANLPIISSAVTAETAKLVNGKIRIVRNTLEG